MGDHRAAGRGIFSGSSESEERHRTLFMVGDFKQAIYGFQGTDPQPLPTRPGRSSSAAPKRWLGDDLFDAISARARVPRPVDRRQLPLGPADPGRGRRGDRHGRPRGAGACASRRRAHRAHHAERPGQVELWQPSPSKSRRRSDEGEERWVSLRDRYYAEALAERIGRWSMKRRCSLDRPPLTPGDILVLVRSRGELASLIVARLFSAGVPVAGVDRLHLHEPLAVQDLLAAVKFAVQPNDDLNLACLLVSPLIGWDQDQLRALAYGRKGSLWRELRAARSGELRAMRMRRCPSCCGSPISRRRRASSKPSCRDRCRAGASSTPGSAWLRATRSTS